MKKKILALSLLSVLIITGCKNNPISSSSETPSINVTSNVEVSSNEASNNVSSSDVMSSNVASSNDTSSSLASNVLLVL